MLKQEFREFDESLKDKLWMQRILIDLQTKKQFLIKKAQYDINQSFADGCYDIESSRKKYDVFNVAPNEVNIDFTPLDLFGNRITAIQSIIEKQGFEVKARCTDVTAVSKKERDIELLKAEKTLEPIRKQFSKALGLSQPLPIAKPEDFSSDISPVKEMGLDMTNPVDEGIYKNVFQRQIWEIATELGISHYFSLSEIMELLKMFVQDFINNNVLAGQVVTNSYSGEPEMQYLFPFDVYTILGKRPDKKDAIGKGWEKVVTVRELIALMGSEVTENDLNQILVLANTTTGTNYSAIWFPEHGEKTCDTCCTYGTFLDMVCSLGYLEFKSQNSDLYYHRSDNGIVFTDKKDFSYSPPKNLKSVDRMPKKDNEQYLEYKFYDVTYKAYYIPFSNFVFGFGKLPLATRFGSKNQLTDFSIVTYKQRGKSMNEACQPFILHIFDLWCKFQHFINESRPSGESYDIDVVREMAQEFIGTDGKRGDLINTMRILQNMTNTVHKTKTIDGMPVGGDGDPYKARIRGIDPTVDKIMMCRDDDFKQIEMITGVNSVLLAQSAPTGDTGYRVSALALQQSINTIYYIQSAIQKTFSNASFNICQKIQYILNGDKNNEAYKSLQKAIGDRNCQSILDLGDDPPYSFSIFFEFGLSEIQRQEIKQLTSEMMAAKLITATQAMQINSISNYKLASALLSYYEMKAFQQAQQQQQMMAQMAAQAEQQKSDNKVKELTTEGTFKVQVANTTGEWTYKTKQLEMGIKDQIQDKKEISKHLGTQIDHQNNQQNMVLENELSKEDIEP